MTVIHNLLDSFPDGGKLGRQFAPVVSETRNRCHIESREDFHDAIVVVVVQTVVHDLDVLAQDLQSILRVVGDEEI